MQPSYYFHENRESGLEIIHNSVAQQAVLNSSGAVIGGTKTSDTEIGFEMEIDERYFTDSAYRERYQAYVDTFAEFVAIPHCVLRKLTRGYADADKADDSVHPGRSECEIYPAYQRCFRLSGRAYG